MADAPAGWTALQIASKRNLEQAVGHLKTATRSIKLLTPEHEEDISITRQCWIELENITNRIARIEFDLEQREIIMK